MASSLSSGVTCSEVPDILEQENSLQKQDAEDFVQNDNGSSQQTPEDDNHLIDAVRPIKDPSELNQQTNDSNEKLLTAAFLSFMSFTIIQTIAAFIAKSNAMMGDSAAMCVDALSYAINLYAEREKKGVVMIGSQSMDTESRCIATNQSLDQWESSQDISYAQDQRLMKRKLLLELLPPILSIFALLLVTVYTTKKALNNLLADQSVPRTSASPNTLIMTIFSSLNLLLDILNLAYFISSEPQPKSYPQQMIYSSLEDAKVISDMDEDTSKFMIADDASDRDRYFAHDPSAADETNLNMCSAYTHIIADTIRSVAVLIAAAVASLTSKVTPEKADALAAIVVAIVIVLSLFPLIKGLYLKYLEFQRTDDMKGSIDYSYRKIQDTTMDSYECVKLIPKL